MSVFPALGAVLGIGAVAAGGLYLTQVGLEAPVRTAPSDLSSAVVILLGCCLAGLATMFIAGLAGAAGGERR